MLCADGPVKTLVGLALAPEHRRGHGALYTRLNHGRLDVDRLRRALVSVPLPKAADGRLVLAVDVSPWLRPDADTEQLEIVALPQAGSTREALQGGFWRLGAGSPAYKNRTPRSRHPVNGASAAVQVLRRRRKPVGTDPLATC